MSDDSEDSSSEDEVPQQIRPGMYGGKRPAGKRPAKAPRVGGVGGKAAGTRSAMTAASRVTKSPSAGPISTNPPPLTKTSTRVSRD